MTEIIDDEEAARFLEEKDRLHGVNTIVEKTDEVITPEPPSLGKVASYPNEVELSPASESTWKILRLDTLPSKGMFYPQGAEIFLRSAKTKEIRHWSTIDEDDPIDVREKINFILNSCTKFHNSGGRPLNFNDFVEIDRYHILFRIYELTFPNQENKLWANIKCENTTCGHVNRTQVLSMNLRGFELPKDLMKWYSEEHRCFVVVSEKLNETFTLHMPTIGVDTKFRQKRTDEISKGTEIDESFYDFGPYLIPEWRSLTPQTLTDLKFTSNLWPDNKFMFIHKFTNELKKASLNRAASLCEKCKQITESHIFLEGSFTVKDFFIVSAGLDELI
jgi:hypothetical protein